MYCKREGEGGEGEGEREEMRIGGNDNIIKKDVRVEIQTVTGKDL